MIPTHVEMINYHSPKCHFVPSFKTKWHQPLSRDNFQFGFAICCHFWQVWIRVRIHLDKLLFFSENKKTKTNGSHEKLFLSVWLSHCVSKGKLDFPPFFSFVKASFYHPLEELILRHFHKVRGIKDLSSRDSHLLVFIFIAQFKQFSVQEYFVA